jgi:predicted ArsR family transcriptional regulator
LTSRNVKVIFGFVRITDPRALRALAHPLRLDLVELLGSLGQATAAACARQLGTSQASCSFHLRQLAKYGFVEQATPSEDSRERPWRLTDLEQSWSADAGLAADQLERVFVQREADRILAWLAADDASDAWRKSSFVGGATLPVTVDELKSIRADLRAAIAPYVRRLSDRSDWPADARFVRILLAGTPLELDPANDNPEESP